MPCHDLPCLRYLHARRDDFVKFAVAAAPRFKLSTFFTPLGSLLPYQPRIADCSSAIGPNFGKVSFRVLKTRSACAIGNHRHQSSSVQFLALLGSPLVGCHHAHHSLGPTTVVQPVARPCHCRAPPHSSRARGRLSLSHLRSIHHAFRFRGESLVLVHYLLCPGRADVHRNGITVLVGCPPSWSKPATMSRCVCLCPALCVRA